MKSLYNTFSKTERAIADFMIHNASETTTLTVSEMAAKCGTSDASIVRLAQKIGYTGYYALKIALVSTLSRGDSPSKLETGLETGDGADLLDRIAVQSERNIADTVKKLDRTAVSEAVRLIDKAERLALFAAGNSVPVIMDAAYKFTVLGKQVLYSISPEMAILTARQLRKRDVAIAFSHSGSSRLTIECATIAKEGGVPTIAVTNYRTSPLTQVSQLTLLTSVHDSIMRNDFVVSRTAEMVLVDVLFFVLASRRKTNLESDLAISESALSEFKL